MDAQTVRRWLTECVRVISEESSFLTQLDAAIGDADHGANMAQGFAAIEAALAELGPETPPGAVLKEAGSRFMSSVGGANGSLWGSALRRAGRVLSEADSANPKAIALVLEGMLRAVVELGAAQPGDKTMVDALDPALRALEAVLERGGGLLEAAEAAQAAAEQGVRDTVVMVARKGRASYLGERSVGHQGPGATSTALIIAALRCALT